MFEGGGSWGGCGVVLALVSGLVVAAFVDIDLREIPDEITIGGMHFLPAAALIFPDLHTRPVDGSVSRLLAGAEPTLRRVSEASPAGFSRGPLLFILVAGGAVLSGGVSIRGYKAYRAWRSPEEPRRFRDLSLAGVVGAGCGGVLLAQLLQPEWTLSLAVYSFWAAMAGMLTGSGLVFLVFRKPAMGFGDVKLMGLLGGFAGWAGVAAGFFVASLLGSLIGVVRLVMYSDWQHGRRSNKPCRLGVLEKGGEDERKARQKIRLVDHRGRWQVRRDLVLQAGAILGGFAGMISVVHRATAGGSSEVASGCQSRHSRNRE